jgi:hypothetical protein
MPKLKKISLLMIEHPRSSSPVNETFRYVNYFPDLPNAGPTSSI